MLNVTVEDVLAQPAFAHISRRTLYRPASRSTATTRPSSPARAAAIVVLFPGAAVASRTLTPFFLFFSRLTSFSSLVSTLAVPSSAAASSASRSMSASTRYDESRTHAGMHDALSCAIRRASV